MTLVLSAALLVARRPESFSNPQFWGDDGAFYQMAYTDGWKVLFLPYAGYQHLFSRMVAEGAIFVDPRWVPAFFVGCASLATLYVAARTQSARSPLPRVAACAFAVVLVPDAFEVLHSLVNVQWVLAGGLLLLLISADPHRWIEYGHDLIAAVVLGFEGPFSAFLAPLFIVRALFRRSAASWIVAAAVTVCGAVQTWYIAHGPDVYPVGGRIAWEALVAVSGMRIVGSLFVGFLVPPDYPRVVETLLGIIFLAGLTGIAVHKGAARPARLWLAAGVIVLLAASLYRIRYGWADLCHATYGSRYFFPLQLGCIWLLFIGTQDNRRWISYPMVAMLLWALVINLPRLREPPFGDFHWANYASKIRAGEAVTIPINPPPWSISLPPRPSH